MKTFNRLTQEEGYHIYLMHKKTSLGEIVAASVLVLEELRKLLRWILSLK